MLADEWLQGRIISRRGARDRLLTYRNLQTFDARWKPRHDVGDKFTLSSRVQCPLSSPPTLGSMLLSKPFWNLQCLYTALRPGCSESGRGTA